VAAAAPVKYAGDEVALVVMGRIVGSFGVQGWLKVNPFTESADGLAQFARWLVRTREGWIEMGVEDFALHSKGPVAKLAGCDDRTAADRLRGCDVAILRAAMGEAGAGQIYRVDLVGLEVVDARGTGLGRVEGFFDTGETGVMVVKGERERMIPFIPEYVKSVDRKAGRITVDWKADYDA
jgi:16S rRNA processing protein RimM